MFGLHKIDQHRTAKSRQAAEKRELARYGEAQKELETRMPHIAGLFSPGIRQHLLGNGSAEGDEVVARLLQAIHLSIPFSPEVSVMVNAQAPYKFCVITASSEEGQNSPPVAPKPLKRRFLTDLPTQWERETVEAVFRGQQLTVPSESQGVFIDNRKPGAWGMVKHENNVVAVVMVRAQ
ncbi:MAG: hypothetical protein ACR2OZ_07880 [Verrucomicrobiales bacterium]